MKIVIRKLDGAVIQVSESASLPSSAVNDGDPQVFVNAADVDVHDIPNWDWSMADLTGVDTSKKNWMETELMWDGTTLVKKV